MGTVDDGQDGSAIDGLEFDLNQLRESPTLSVHEIVNKYLPQPAETVEDGSSDEDEVPDEPISPPSRNEADEAIEILNRLTLFATDLDLDPLLLKVSNKINQRKLDRMKQSSISDFFKKAVTAVF